MHKANYEGPLAAVREIRSLFALQDAVANGHRSAVELQKSMIVQIERRLLEADHSAGAGQLAPSVAGYVLSGGNPAAAERLVEVEHLAKRDKHLLKGAALYMRGNGEEAGRELKQVEIESLPPPVGGRVALARAMLAVGDEAAKQALLQTAIALMPGTLVEESALRRSALSYAEAGDQQRFWLRASRYLRRFKRSVYAHDFTVEVVDRIVALEQAGKKPDLQRLDLLLQYCDHSSRLKLYAELARLAAAANLPDLTKFGARRLRRLAAPGSPEAQAAELYDFIFEAASGQSDAAAERLGSIKRQFLSSRERGLLAAALLVTSQIRAPAKIELRHARDETDTGKTGIEQRADAALERAQALLTETMQ